MKNGLNSLLKDVFRRGAKPGVQGKSQLRQPGRGNGRPGGPAYYRLPLLRRLQNLADLLKGQPVYGRSAGPRTALLRGRYWLPLVLVLLLSGCWLGARQIAGMVTAAEFFRIENSSCVGCKVITNRQLMEEAGFVLHRTSLIAIDEERTEKRLLQRIPWLASIQVEKDLPSTVHFRVRENTPAAILQRGESRESDLYYLNGKGDILLPVPLGGKLDLPVLTGFKDMKDPEQRQLLQEAVSFLARVEKNNPVFPKHLVSEIHATGNGELICYLVNPHIPIYLRKGNMGQKYENLTKILADLYKTRKKDENRSIENTGYILMNETGSRFTVGKMI